MPFMVVLHIQNADPVLGEMEELPSPADNLVIVKNPRRVDGKDLQFLHENTMTVVWPVERLNYVEILSSDEDEKIIGFVRE
jgi:hypothetical protein